jgi:hypothetical protein
MTEALDHKWVRPKVTTVWVAYKTNEDGKPTARLGVCSTERKARIVAQNQGGGAGVHGKVSSARALLFPPSEVPYAGRLAYLLDGDPLVLDHQVEEMTEEIRQQALKKLSDAEREALGLPDPEPPVEVYDRT